MEVSENEHLSAEVTADCEILRRTIYKIASGEFERETLTGALDVIKNGLLMIISSNY